jgi:aspartate dehydrogenase
MRITIVGCGSIGSKLAKAADEMDEVKRIYLVDIKKDIADKVAAGLKKAIVVDSIEDELYHCDLVIEASTQEAAREVAPRVVSRGVDMMIMSVGSLVDDDYRKALFQKAKEHEAKIFIPTGALCGVDGLRSASGDEILSVTLTTTKGPKSLAGVQYLIDKGIDVNAVKEKTVVYSGPAREAVKIFPKNINVAATVSLLGIGFDRTQVKIVLDPMATSNSHELDVEGNFGKFTSHTYNVPSPDNPKTSYNVHKEWDKKRGCYVYKDNMGNFVGRDKPSMDKQEKWVKDKEKNWLEELKVPQGKGADKPQPTKKSSSYSSDEYDNSDGGYDQGYEEEEEDYSGGGMSYDEYVRRSAHGEVQVSKIVIRSDDELRRAEEGMKEVENAIKEIKKIDPSANVNEYIDPQIVKKVENAIKEYKRKHARG